MCRPSRPTLHGWYLTTTCRLPLEGQHCDHPSNGRKQDRPLFTEGRAVLANRRYLKLSSEANASLLRATQFVRSRWAAIQLLPYPFQSGAVTL